MVHESIFDYSHSKLLVLFGTTNDSHFDKNSSEGLSSYWYGNELQLEKWIRNTNQFYSFKIKKEGKEGKAKIVNSEDIRIYSIVQDRYRFLKNDDDYIALAGIRDKSTLNEKNENERNSFKVTLISFSSACFHKGYHSDFEI